MHTYVFSVIDWRQDGSDVCWILQTWTDSVSPRRFCGRAYHVNVLPWRDVTFKLWRVNCDITLYAGCQSAGRGRETNKLICPVKSSFPGRNNNHGHSFTKVHLINVSLLSVTFKHADRDLDLFSFKSYCKETDFFCFWGFLFVRTGYRWVPYIHMPAVRLKLTGSETIKCRC